MSAPVSAISGRSMQLGLETVENTSTAANKKFQSLSFNMSPDIETQAYAPQGNFFDTTNIPLTDMSVGDLEGVGSYTELAYLFASLLAYAAPTQIAATTAYTWTFTPSIAAADTHKTYTVEQGSAGAAGANKVTGVYVNEVSLDISRADGISVGGSVVGRQYQTGQTFTVTPTLIPFVPILPTQISVYMDTTWAGLGTTKLLDDIAVNFSFGNRFTPWWALNASNPSFASKVNAKPSTDVSLKMAANAVGYAYLAKLRAGTTVFVRVQAVGDIIEAANAYALTLDMALQYTGAAGEDEDSDALVLEAPMSLVADPTSGFALKVTMITSLVTL